MTYTISKPYINADFYTAQFKPEMNARIEGPYNKVKEHRENFDAFRFRASDLVNRLNQNEIERLGGILMTPPTSQGWNMKATAALIEYWYLNDYKVGDINAAFSMGDVSIHRVKKNESLRKFIPEHVLSFVQLGGLNKNSMAILNSRQGLVGGVGPKLSFLDYYTKDQTDTIFQRAGMYDHNFHKEIDIQGEVAGIDRDKYYKVAEIDTPETSGNITFSLIGGLAQNAHQAKYILSVVWDKSLIDLLQSGVVSLNPNADDPAFKELEFYAKLDGTVMSVWVKAKDIFMTNFLVTDIPASNHAEFGNFGSQTDQPLTSSLIKQLSVKTGAVEIKNIVDRLDDINTKIVKVEADIKALNGLPATVATAQAAAVKASTDAAAALAAAVKAEAEAKKAATVAAGMQSQVDEKLNKKWPLSDAGKLFTIDITGNAVLILPSAIVGAGGTYDDTALRNTITDLAGKYVSNPSGAIDNPRNLEDLPIGAAFRGLTLKQKKESTLATLADLEGSNTTLTQALLDIKDNKDELAKTNTAVAGKALKDLTDVAVKDIIAAFTRAGIDTNTLQNDLGAYFGLAMPNPQYTDRPDGTPLQNHDWFIDDVGVTWSFGGGLWHKPAIPVVDLTPYKTNAQAQIDHDAIEAKILKHITDVTLEQTAQDTLIATKMNLDGQNFKNSVSDKGRAIFHKSDGTDGVESIDIMQLFKDLEARNLIQDTNTLNNKNLINSLGGTITFNGDKDQLKAKYPNPKPNTAYMVISPSGNELDVFFPIIDNSVTPATGSWPAVMTPDKQILLSGLAQAIANSEAKFLPIIADLKKQVDELKQLSIKTSLISTASVPIGKSYYTKDGITIINRSVIDNDDNTVANGGVFQEDITFQGKSYDTTSGYGPQGYNNLLPPAYDPKSYQPVNEFEKKWAWFAKFKMPNENPIFRVQGKVMWDRRTSVPYNSTLLKMELTTAIAGTHDFTAAFDSAEFELDVTQSYAAAKVVRSRSEIGLTSTWNHEISAQTVDGWTYLFINQPWSDSSGEQGNGFVIQNFEMFSTLSDKVQKLLTNAGAGVKQADIDRSVNALAADIRLSYAQLSGLNFDSTALRGLQTKIQAMIDLHKPKAIQFSSLSGKAVITDIGGVVDIDVVVPDTVADNAANADVIVAVDTLSDPTAIKVSAGISQDFKDSIDAKIAAAQTLLEESIRVVSENQALIYKEANGLALAPVIDKIDVSGVLDEAGDLFQYTAGSRIDFDFGLVGTASDHNTHIIAAGSTEVFHIKSASGNIDVSFKAALDVNGIITLSQFVSNGTIPKTMADVLLKAMFEIKPAAKTDLTGYVKTSFLTTELAKKVDKSTLVASIKAELVPYAKTADMTTALGLKLDATVIADYTTTVGMTAAIAAAVAPYVKTVDLTTTLADYSTTVAITALLKTEQDRIKQNEDDLVTVKADIASLEKFKLNGDTTLITGYDKAKKQRLEHDAATDDITWVDVATTTVSSSVQKKEYTTLTPFGHKDEIMGIIAGGEDISMYLKQTIIGGNVTATLTAPLVGLSATGATETITIPNGGSIPLGSTINVEFSVNIVGPPAVTGSQSFVMTTLGVRTVGTNLPGNVDYTIIELVANGVGNKITSFTIKTLGGSNYVLNSSKITVAPDYTYSGVTHVSSKVDEIKINTYGHDSDTHYFFWGQKPSDGTIFNYKDQALTTEDLGYALVVEWVPKAQVTTTKGAVHVNTFP